MIVCPICGNETPFRTEFQLEEESCPYCGFSGFFRDEPEPKIIVRPPAVKRVVTPNFVVIMRAISLNKWEPIRNELEKASRGLGEDRYSDVCNNLRMGLVALWRKVDEQLSGQQVLIDQSGKTTDIAPLIKILKEKEIPDDTIGLITRTWSFLSERAHIDKKGAVQPSKADTLYGFQLSLAAIEFLLRILHSKTTSA